MTDAVNRPRIRKIQLVTERVHHAGGPDLAQPAYRGSIAAVVANRFSGTHELDLIPIMDSLGPLGVSLAEELRDALTGDGDRIEGYGKGAIVGVAGELELAAVWHVPGGAGLRAALGNPRAMVPSSKKVGVLGSQLDVPMVHLHASYLQSHYDVMPVVVPDAPRPDEIVYVLVMTTTERPHQRLGGFTIDEVSGEDGLR
jgi:hypothetical protein